MSVNYVNGDSYIKRKIFSSSNVYFSLISTFNYVHIYSYQLVRQISHHRPSISPTYFCTTAQRGKTKSKRVLVSQSYK